MPELWAPAVCVKAGGSANTKVITQTACFQCILINFYRLHKTIADSGLLSIRALLELKASRTDVARTTCDSERLIPGLFLLSGDIKKRALPLLEDDGREVTKWGRPQLQGRNYA
jgi:hypothetical protein